MVVPILRALLFATTFALAAPAAAATSRLVPRSAPSRAPLVYVCDRTANAVDIFQAGVLNGAKMVGRLTKGVDQPVDVYVDRLGTAYVLNVGNRSVSVYAAGHTSPTEIVSSHIDQPQYVHAGSDGTIYVLALDPTNTNVNWILEFYKGQLSPSLIIEPPQQTGLDPIVLSGLTIDSSNRLYTDFTDLCGAACGSTFVQVYPARSKNSLPFGYGGGLRYPGDVEYIASKHVVLVGDTQEKKIHGYYDLTLARGPRQPFRTFASAAAYFAYDDVDGYLYVSDNGNGQVTIVDIFSGKTIGSIKRINAAGLAVDPPADY